MQKVTVLVENQVERFSPVSSDHLRQLLNHGIVCFAFHKKDGSLRRAVGTTNMKQIPGIAKPRSGRKAPDSIVPFYDVELNEWRSVSVYKPVYQLN
jgi:hypothetical protein